MPQQIVKVNGENGANAYQMAPNSSALLLDEKEPLVYLVQTDGAGYKSISAYTITKYIPEPPVNVATLEERIKRLEEYIYTVVMWRRRSMWTAQNSMESLPRLS